MVKVPQALCAIRSLASVTVSLVPPPEHVVNAFLDFLTSLPVDVAHANVLILLSLSSVIALGSAYALMG